MSTPFTLFNRQLEMTPSTRKEIMNVIDLVDDFTPSVELDFDIKNTLFGLFDGYLYDHLILQAQAYPVEIYTRIVDIYFTCKDYKCI
jgi:hypothetical protein